MSGEAFEIAVGAPVVFHPWRGVDVVVLKNGWSVAVVILNQLMAEPWSDRLAASEVLPSVKAPVAERLAMVGGERLGEAAVKVTYKGTCTARLQVRWKL